MLRERRDPKLSSSQTNNQRQIKTTKNSPKSQQAKRQRISMACDPGKPPQAATRETDNNNNNNNRSRGSSADGSNEQVPLTRANALLCAGCGKHIRERYLLEALNKQWHEDCLKCVCCECRLGEVGSTLYVHAEKILCRRDFLRIFCPNGNCAACKQCIPPYELVMRANDNAYHLDCFSCNACNYRFCVGDKFYLSAARAIVCTACHALDSAAALAAVASQAASGTSSSVSDQTTVVAKSPAATIAQPMSASNAPVSRLEQPRQATTPTIPQPLLASPKTTSASCIEDQCSKQPISFQQKATAQKCDSAHRHQVLSVCQIKT